MDVKLIIFLLILISIFFSTGCLNDNTTSENKNKLKILFLENIEEDVAKQIVLKYNVTLISVSNSIIIVDSNEVKVLSMIVSIDNLEEADTIIQSMNNEPNIYSCEYVKKTY